MQRLGRMWPYLKKHLSLEEELAAINAVTLDGLRALAKDYPVKPRTVGRLAPKTA